VAERLPVVLVTGFLGSGKTTLLCRLLGRPELGETAVIVNELGEVAIDHHLLRRVDERTVLLANGCLCCTLRGDLADELRDLLRRRTRGEIPAFRRVLVETTGLADPATMRSAFLHGAQFAPFADRIRAEYTP
jgi:G3E family GTPase